MVGRSVQCSWRAILYNIQATRDSSLVTKRNVSHHIGRYYHPLKVAIQFTSIFLLVHLLALNRYYRYCRYTDCYWDNACIVDIVVATDEKANYPNIIMYEIYRYLLREMCISKITLNRWWRIFLESNMNNENLKMFIII